MSDPLGLFESSDKDPLGLFSEEKPKEKTSFMEDVRQGISGMGNTADTLGTLAVGGAGTLLGMNKDGKLDSLFEGLAERKKSRNEWAGGEGKEKGIGGAITSAITGLPGMLLTPVSGLDRATDLMDKGVPLSEAGPAGLIDSVLSTAGMAVPIIGKTLAGKAAAGAAANVVAGGAADVATQAIVSDKKAKEGYNPLDPERRITEAVLGAAAGPLTGKTKAPEAKPKSASDKLNKLQARTEPTLPPEPKVGSLDNVPQAIKDQQAIYNRTPIEDVVQQPIRDTQTQELPFDADVNEIVRNQYEQDFTNPTDEPMQRDMFAEQDLLAQDKDPYADTQNRLFEEEAAYQQRAAENDAAVNAENARRAAEDEKVAVQRAQELRDEIYRPLEDSLTQRTSKGQKRKAMSRQRGAAARQRGAIDYDAVKEGIDFLKKGLFTPKDVIASYKGAFHPDKMKKAMEVIDNPSSADKMVLMTPDQFHELALPRSYRSAVDLAGIDEKQFAVHIGLQSEKGLRDIPYLRLENKNGKTVVDAHEGRHRMDVFKQQGVELVPVRIRVGKDAQWGSVLPEKQRYNLPVEPVQLPEPIQSKGMVIPKGQRGAITFGKGKEVVALDESNPEVVAARSLVARSETAKALMGTDEGFRSNIDTPAKVVAAVLDGAKDISWVAKQRGMTITGGSNRLAGQTNHPLIKFTRDAVRKSLRDSEDVMRQFVTNKDGLGGMWQRMSQAERNEVMGAWKHGDEIQQRITKEQMIESGFTARQYTTLEHIYKMQDFLFERTNEAYVHAGLDPIRQRDGHMPGVFKGDYRSLVMKRDGVDKAGKPIWKPVQYFGANTKQQHYLIRRKVENMFQGPGYMIKDIEQMPNSKRVGLAGEMQVFIDLLGHNDKAFADVQAKLKEISAESAAKLYGAHLHAKEKIGIGGNEGNKFWKSVDENTNEGMKAYLQYYEDTIASHNLLKTEVDLNGLLNNPVLDTQPNAKEYVHDYMRNVQGRSLGRVGDALDTLITTPFDVIGIGESAVRAGVHQITKRLGQKAMGYFNIPFTAMQLVQVAQTGLPEIIGLKGNAELTGVQAAKAMKEAAADSYVLLRDAISGSKTTEPGRRAMFDYAEANGLLNFSEFADVNKVTQSKLGERFDFYVDLNRVIGEVTTRPAVFFTFVRMLEKSGLPKSEVFDMAYNKTQYAMVDYTPPELPMMYSKLGMVGKSAGTLKTFQHAFSGQQLDWLNRFRKGDVTPLVTGATMGVLFAGVTGMAGYQEADQVFQYITDKMGKRQTIREAALSNLKGWAQNGVLSDMTNINLQSRLGQANLLPESLVDAVSPYASSSWDMLTSANELRKDPNAITATNAAKAWAPSSMRGPVENMMSRGDELRDASGMPTGMTYTKDKEGRNDYPRDERDWKLRLLGLTSMEESLFKEKLYNDTLANMSDKDARAKILTYMLRGFRTQDKFGVTKDYEALREKYMARGGDPEQLVATLQREIQEGKKSRKQRLEGIPNGSIGSIHNYESYNK